VNRRFLWAACVSIGTACAARAATPYDDALAALTGIDKAEDQELDALLARPADAAFFAEPRAAALLKPNQKALALFREATQAPSDGYLFAPKVDSYDAKTAIPLYDRHVRLVKLLLLDAKLAAPSRPRRAEADLLAALGFATQVSQQKTGALSARLVAALTVGKADAQLIDSARDRAASPAYLKELAARLERLAKVQDFMRAGFEEEALRNEGAVRESFTPEMVAREQAEMPMLQRVLSQKDQDAEYSARVLSLYNAATDARTRALIAAFRANDLAVLEDYDRKLAADIAARKKARESVALWERFLDGARGGALAKRQTAEASADALLSVRAPAYPLLLAHEHAFLSELSVLRAGVAVERYRRDRKVPPAKLARLKPGYLDAVPTDSFNRFAPLRYAASKTSFLVYGVGPDRKDHGGLPLDLAAFMDDKPAVGDFVFRD